MRVTQDLTLFRGDYRSVRMSDKDQTQGEACAAPFKVPIGGTRYAELTEPSLQSGSEILGNR